MKPKWKRPKKRGMGDVIEVLALPVAEVMDRFLHTNFVGCSSCQKRKEFLNDLVPFNKEDK